MRLTAHMNSEDGLRVEIVDSLLYRYGNLQFEEVGSFERANNS